MNKFPWLLLTALMISLIFTSCEESEVESEYANWQARNQQVTDSIAAVAEANADGNWRIYKNYRLPADDPNDLTAEKDVNNYVYCHIEEAGEGTVSPTYTDSIRVNYRAWFINGKVLDQSFRGDFNPAISVPADFALSNLIDGWITALQHMHTGDACTIYIPYNLAYGESSSSGVPAFSTLVFWVNLVGIYPKGITVPDWQ